MKMKTTELNEILTKTLNELDGIDRVNRLKMYVKKADTKTLKKYLSGKTNENWTIECSIANDELIKRN
tara:strand:+ start:289 stop:492 length:204 start_codon:yes stop_codon:yes gene_type:complete